MALPKFPKTKSFHVDYCGCTAATSLLNENSVQDAINSIRCTKSKRDFVKATVSTHKDGIRIIYENKEKYSTHVPASMIACSTMNKTSFRNTVGVVYISPLTGRHYPAFVHVYHCESSRTAQKLLNRLRYYTKIENHYSDLVKLERQLLEHDLLNISHSQTSNLPIQQSESATSTSSKTNTAISSSSSNSNSRPEKIDPVKSITEEFQRKIQSKQPILFPPKDYDTFHAGHGNIQRAHGWKSTQPSIVGDVKSHTPHQARRKLAANSQNSSIPPTKPDGFYKSTDDDDDFLCIDRRVRSSTDRNDQTMDPVETVSLAFEFLKDETGSIFNGSDGNIEHLDVEESTKPPIFRFRPAPIVAVNKNAIHSRSNHELNVNDQMTKQQANGGMDSYYNKAHRQRQLTNGQRTRSETTAETRSRPGMLLSPRYESRLANGSGAPIPTNPLWIGMTSSMAGSQPNLLSPETSSFQHPLSRHLSPAIPRRSVDVPLKHPLYAIHQDNRLVTSKQTPIISIKRPAPAPPLSSAEIPDNRQRRQTTHYPYFNANEFILRASDNQILKNLPSSNRPTSELKKEFGLPLRSSISHSTTMLDVYY